MQRNRLHYSVYYENTHYYLYKKKIRNRSSFSKWQFVAVIVCKLKSSTDKAALYHFSF